MPKAYSKDFREKLLQAWDRRELMQEELARLFGVSVSFLRKLIAQRQETGSIDPKPHAGGAGPKLGPDALNELQNLIDKQPDATHKELRDKLLAQTGLSISVRGIGRAIKRLGLTRKKKTKSASEQDRPDVAAKREEHKSLAMEIDPTKLHCLDESGMRVGETRAYGLSKPGERIEEKVPGKRWETITMIGTLGVGGITSMATIQGAVNGDIFESYVEQILVPALKPGDIVMMDNLQVHKNAAACAAIKAAGASVMYLPPYSPDLNPVEHAWAKLKGILRTAKAQTREALEAAVGPAIEAITASNARGWFSHCGYRTCIQEVA